MEKAKISSKQLFSLIVLFELGSAVVVGLGMDAKQDAWLAILLGMFAGLALFLVYGYLFCKYPTLLLTQYTEKILGKYIGRTLAFFYTLYFIYIASRVLRDFGDLIITAIFSQTPLIVVNLLIILVIGYGCYLGIEVLGRTAEIFFIVIMMLGILFMFFVFASNLPKIENLQPVLEEGLKPVLKTAFPLTLTFPFGEMIVFTMLLPYMNKPQQCIRTGLEAMILSGLLLSFTIVINISVLGAHSAANTPFPLLMTIKKVNVADFIQRLDPIALLALIIGGFFKITIFSYAAVIGLSDLFKVKQYQKLIPPICIVTLIASIKIASNFTEHIDIGLNEVPFYLHIPFQIGIPLLLLIITLIRKYFQST